MVHSMWVCPLKGTTLKLNDIVFIEANANWVHHPHKDALVITARIANNLVNRILVDNGSAVNILYLHAYQKIRLTRANLSPTTSPIYEFTRGCLIPEHPQVTTIMTEFLAVNCPPAFNGVLGRPLLQAGKAVTLVHCLTMKFPTTVGIDQV